MAFKGNIPCEFPFFFCLLAHLLCFVLFNKAAAFAAFVGALQGGGWFRLRQVGCWGKPPSGGFSPLRSCSLLEARMGSSPRFPQLPLSPGFSTGASESATSQDQVGHMGSVSEMPLVFLSPAARLPQLKELKNFIHSKRRNSRVVSCLFFFASSANPRSKQIAPDKFKRLAVFLKVFSGLLILIQGFSCLVLGLKRH
jgi:hypothetical protein